jgi:hypothetical protein
MRLALQPAPTVLQAPAESVAPTSGELAKSLTEATVRARGLHASLTPEHGLSTEEHNLIHHARNDRSTTKLAQLPGTTRIVSAGAAASTGVCIGVKSAPGPPLSSTNQV